MEQWNTLLTCLQVLCCLFQVPQMVPEKLEALISMLQIRVTVIGGYLRSVLLFKWANTSLNAAMYAVRFGRESFRSISGSRFGMHLSGPLIRNKCKCIKFTIPYIVVSRIIKQPITYSASRFECSLAFRYAKEGPAGLFVCGTKIVPQKCHLNGCSLKRAIMDTVGIDRSLFPKTVAFSSHKCVGHGEQSRCRSSV